MFLHPISTNVMAGLLEAVAAPPYNGRADLPDLATRLQLEADQLFHLGETLQLLRLAALSEGDLVITDAGKLSLASKPMLASTCSPSTSTPMCR